MFNFSGIFMKRSLVFAALVFFLSFGRSFSMIDVVLDKDDETLTIVEQNVQKDTINLNLSNYGRFHSSVEQLPRNQWQGNLQNNFVFLDVFYALFRQSLKGVKKSDQPGFVSRLLSGPAENKGIIRSTDVSSPFVQDDDHEGFNPLESNNVNFLWRTVLLFLSFNEQYRDAVARNIDVFVYFRKLRDQNVLLISTNEPGSIKVEEVRSDNLSDFIQSERKKLPEDRNFHQMTIQNKTVLFALPEVGTQNEFINYIVAEFD